MLMTMIFTLLIPLSLPSIVATAASQNVVAEQAVTAAQENSEPLTPADLVNKLKQRDENFTHCVVALRREYRSEVNPSHAVVMADWQHNKHLRKPQDFVRNNPKDLPWLKC